MHLCYEFETPEEALEHLFVKAEKSPLARGRAHIWKKYDTMGYGCGVTGAEYVSREDLVGRNYQVKWCNDIVSIKYEDAIFMRVVSGRTNYDTRNVIVRFPTLVPV